jgi:glucoamylase
MAMSAYRASACLLALVALGAFAPAALGKDPAPGAPGTKHTWAPADKHGFGTAVKPRSNVWFTLRQAELTEAYYPDLGTPSLRSLEFVVTDGTFVDRETGPGVRSRVKSMGALSYRQTTRTSRWVLEKTWIADPSRPTVLAKVRLTSLTGKPLRVYALVDPAPGDDGNDDLGTSLRSELSAHDDTVASSVAARPALSQTTSGYAGGASDPWTDLKADGDLDAQYDATTPGNVVQAARTPLTGRRGHRTMVLAIGFGADRAAASGAAAASLARRFDRSLARYALGWVAYLAKLRQPPQSVRNDPALRKLYRQSLLVLAASEDKQNRGASVASPTMPWTWGTLTIEKTETSGPYHLVWPRDLYHVATAQEVAGDGAAARRLLDFLWRVQKADGSFWQNTEVDGREHWTTEQLDETALPIVLAWWLHRRGAADWTHVRAAADYIVANGPQSDQERWENQSGWSPNTIGAEIAGLICAADIARRNGDTIRAQSYEAKADEFERNVQAWTATTNGPYSPDPYYLRITKDGNPNDGSTYDVGDNHTPLEDERLIVDQSFLGLVLFGAKRADDPVIRNSLAVGDRILKADTANGPVWHRFTFDGYGETATGGDWDLFPTKANQTLGRVWPILTGERGEYTLLAGGTADRYLQTMARTANDGLMLPEQVWDGRPPTGQPGAASGEGTRSATPLAWTHGQFVRLAWSISRGRPVERPCIVAERYKTGAC